MSLLAWLCRLLREQGADNNPGNNSILSKQVSIFQLFPYPIYLMTKPSVISYFMAMSRPVMRGNGFAPLPTRALPPPSLEGPWDASRLSSLHLCTCHTSKISYPFPYLNLQFCLLLDPPALALQTFLTLASPPVSSPSQSHPPQRLLCLAVMSAASDWHPHSKAPCQVLSQLLCHLVPVTVLVLHI